MISPVDLLLAFLKLGKWDFWAPACGFGARVCTVKSKGNTDGGRVKLTAAVKSSPFLIIIKQQESLSLSRTG